jgi:hypothetical protein
MSLKACGSPQSEQGGSIDCRLKVARLSFELDDLIVFDCQPLINGLSASRSASKPVLKQLNQVKTNCGKVKLDCAMKIL